MRSGLLKKTREPTGPQVLCVMGTNNLSPRVKTLASFRRSKNRGKYINNCSPKRLHYLCEAVFNFIFNNETLGLKKKTVEQVKHQEARLLSLCAKETSLKRRREILNETAEIQNLITHSIYPRLRGLLRKCRDRA